VARTRRRGQARRTRPPDVTEIPTRSFTSDEVARLRKIFPDGVCDYGRPGVNQVDLLSTWITYTGVGEYKAGR